MNKIAILLFGVLSMLYQKDLLIFFLNCLYEGKRSFSYGHLLETNLLVTLLFNLAN